MVVVGGGEVHRNGPDLPCQRSPLGESAPANRLRSVRGAACWNACFQWDRSYERWQHGGYTIGGHDPRLGSFDPSRCFTTLGYDVANSSLGAVGLDLYTGMGARRHRSMWNQRLRSDFKPAAHVRGRARDRVVPQHVQHALSGDSPEHGN